MKNMIFTEENIYQGNLVLINRDFPICDALYDLSAAVNKYPDIKLQRHVSAKLQKLISVLKCDEKIIPVSGYRHLRNKSEFTTIPLLKTAKTSQKSL